ncbi:hypothetical protein PCANC_22038 [Puccinia coronata f. sp. avenae]|uniref:Uncharacterized protein n=1 Tax=Puccinia coronata f. sp. avenae TaxID=200324 RepID=A0A2N5S5H8_9BASI|nr:hypothetical protein PCANC_22038 [Puccinia coronata f. sp. avenae]
MWNLHLTFIPSLTSHERQAGIDDPSLVGAPLHPVSQPSSLISLLHVASLQLWYMYDYCHSKFDEPPSKAKLNGPDEVLSPAGIHHLDLLPTRPDGTITTHPNGIKGILQLMRVHQGAGDGL